MSNEIKLILPKLHNNQEHIKNHLDRFNVFDCGRRFGKNILDEDLATATMLAGYPVGWFEPTYKSLADTWREIISMLYPVTKVKSEQEHRIQLITGGVLEMWSLDDPDSGRGRKYKRVFINEAAKVKQLEYAWTNVIRATLADLIGDAFFTSTPKGLNYFFSLWSRAEKEANWKRFKYSTYDNPHIAKSEVDAMKIELPERVFQQEIMADFIEDGAYFQGVDQAATIEQPETLEDHAGHTFYMAADWGLSNDYTVLGVGCADCGRVVDWDRFTNIDFTYQREKLYTMADRWHVEEVLPERNSFGEPNIEIVMSRVNIQNGPDGQPGYYTTATNKPGLIQALANGLEHGQFKVPKAAADELRVYEVETMASGHPKFGAPDGMHDDWVMMLALLYRALTSARVQLF
jgi:hypothetical protein